jgi:DnaK suppressor protein
MAKKSYLKVKELKTIREKLLDEQKKLLVKNKSLTTFNLDKEELSDVTDEATANMLASHDLRMQNREVFYLKKIGQTLERMEMAEFGRCKECDAEIGFERLIARPTAELCITCKEESEMQEKNNIFDRQSKSLGRTLQDMVTR